MKQPKVRSLHEIRTHIVQGRVPVRANARLARCHRNANGDTYKSLLMHVGTHQYFPGHQWCWRPRNILHACSTTVAIANCVLNWDDQYDTHVIVDAVYYAFFHGEGVSQKTPTSAGLAHVSDKYYRISIQQWYYRVPTHSVNTVPFNDTIGYYSFSDTTKYLPIQWYYQAPSHTVILPGTFLYSDKRVPSRVAAWRQALWAMPPQYTADRRDLHWNVCAATRPSNALVSIITVALSLTHAVSLLSYSGHGLEDRLKTIYGSRSFSNFRSLICQHLHISLKEY